MKPGYLHQKTGVDINGLHPRIVDALPGICWCFRAFDSPAVITSGLDGTHMAGSRHYAGLALDLRIWYVDEAALPELVKVLREELGADYDVVQESTHIHIEFHPRD